MKSFSEVSNIVYTTTQLCTDSLVLNSCMQIARYKGLILRDVEDNLKPIQGKW